MATSLLSQRGLGSMASLSSLSSLSPSSRSISSPLSLPSRTPPSKLPQCSASAESSLSSNGVSTVQQFVERAKSMGTVSKKRGGGQMGMEKQRRSEFSDIIDDEEELFCNILDRPQKKHVLLFYHPEMEDLARGVAGEEDNIELRPIKWRSFADGFPDLFIPNGRTVRNRDVAFLASFSSPSVIFEQLSVIYALPRMFVKSFTLVLPFFPTGTQERMEDEGDVATAVTLARICSNIPISRGGPTSVVIFDIHALQERFYFGDNVLPCFESAVPVLKHRLHQLPDSDNIAIAFPDEGAWKRFHKQLHHYPMVVCTKVREGNNRIVKLKEGNPEGKHVVIVDDLVQSGSTLIECQKLLAARGASRVSAFATHGVFPMESWTRFQHDKGDAQNGGFAYFWITDSCSITSKLVKDRKPFEVLSLAGPIQAALQV